MEELAADAIVVEELVKSYGADRAVDGVSFTVAVGEVVALLGPNGAGKSTTVEILEGYRPRDGGSVRVLGADPASASRGLRDRMGIVLQTTGIEPELTVAEAIAHYGACYRRRRGTDELLDLVGLESKAAERVRSLSGGQRRRLDLALGVVGSPDVLFLDEPTTGFDPEARRGAWDLVRTLRNLGTTILLTTHDMEEAQQLADRVIVLSKGRVVADGTPDELRTDVADGAVIRFRLPVTDDPVNGLLAQITGTVSGRGQHLEIRTSQPTADLHRLTSWAVERGVELTELMVSRATLEDAYLALTTETDVHDG